MDGLRRRALAQRLVLEWRPRRGPTAARRRRRAALRLDDRRLSRPLPIAELGNRGGPRRGRGAELSDTQRRILVALCRPFRDGNQYATPATNQQVADEVFLSLDAVKGHLRALFEKFGIADLPQNQKRVRLVELALRNGVISVRELE